MSKTSPQQQNGRVAKRKRPSLAESPTFLPFEDLFDSDDDVIGRPSPKSIPKPPRRRSQPKPPAAAPHAAKAEQPAAVAEPGQPGVGVRAAEGRQAGGEVGSRGSRVSRPSSAMGYLPVRLPVPMLEYGLC